MHGFSILFLTKAFSLLVMVFTNKLLAANLTLEDFGIYKLLFSLLPIIGFASMPGANDAVSYIVTKNKTGEDWVLRKRTFYVFLICIIIAFIHLLSQKFYSSISISNKYLLCLLFIPLITQYDFFISKFTAAKSFVKSSILNLSREVNIFLAVGLAFYFGINNGYQLFACQYFLSHGVEVFRNVAPAGPVGLMVYNKINSQSAPVDIKSVPSPYIRPDGSYSSGISPKLRDDGVWQLTYVHVEDSLRIPEGFWKSLEININRKFKSTHMRFTWERRR